MKSFIRFAAYALAALALLAGSVNAQTYPTLSPIYYPNPTLNMGTFTTAATSNAFQVNGLDTGLIRVSGTFSALSATVQATARTASSPTYTNSSVKPFGGAFVQSITGSGVWEIKVSGWRQFRIVVNSITGTSATFNATGSLPGRNVATSPQLRNSYSAATTGLALVTGATDFFTITGNATTTIRVTRAECQGTVGTAAVTFPMSAILRSTADTGGTSSTLTAIAHDSGNATASLATVKAYTANPTTGTAVGTVRANLVSLPVTAAGAIGTPVVMNFGGGVEEQPITLR